MQDGGYNSYSYTDCILSQLLNNVNVIKYPHKSVMYTQLNEYLNYVLVDLKLYVQIKISDYRALSIL